MENSKEHMKRIADDFIKCMRLNNLSSNETLVDSGHYDALSSFLNATSTHSGNIKMKKHRSKKWRNGIKSKKK